MAPPHPSRLSRRTQWTGSLLVLGFFVWFCATPVGQSLERLAYDGLFQIRGPLSPDPGIVVVAIDEPSFGILAHQWPWPRSWHAQLIDRLFEDGAAAVALDIVFAEPSDPKEDQALLDVLSKHDTIIMANQIDRTEADGFIREIRVGPPSYWLRTNFLQGSINLPVDPDGFIRRVDIAAEDGFLPFALVAAETWCPDVAWPENERLHINFIGPPGTIETVSYYQTILPDHLPKGFFKDKLVFVGFHIQSDATLQQHQSDHFPVPHTRWGHGVMAGVEIHAQLTQGICHSELIRDMDRRLVLALHMLLWCIGGVCFYRFSPGVGAVIWLVISGLSGCGAYVSFFVWNHLWPIMAFIVPFTALIGSRLLFHYVTVQKEKRFIRQAFSTYLSPAVVNRLVRERDALNLGGEQVNITAFFSDIQGFTAISETLSPPQLVTLLNEYLTEMTDIILKNGGTVDKFEGDAIVAFFGAPTAMNDHALKACQSALKMQQRLSTLRDQWNRDNKPPLTVRIGLCSGPAVVGNMGSQNRMDYTMMGDTPNTASRLEGANKVYGTPILVSESTVREAENSIVFREVDKVLLKGKATPITIFEPMAPVDAISDDDNQLLTIYRQGLAVYRQGDWNAALSAFNQALLVRPGDGPARVFKARCKRYQLSPPHQWQGVHTITEK